MQMQLPVLLGHTTVVLLQHPPQHFKSIFHVDLSQLSQSWEVSGWHGGGSDRSLWQKGGSHWQCLVLAAPCDVLPQVAQESTNPEVVACHSALAPSGMMHTSKSL